MKLLVLFLALAVALGAQPKQEKRSADAHEHGAGRLAIAMEGLKGKLELEIPMESLTGFEHQAKSVADRKKVADAQAAIRAQLGKMIQLPAAAGCTIAVTGVEVEQHGNHSEMHTNGTIACRQPLTGEVRFGFGIVFPGIHKIDVQFVSESVQTGAEIVHDRGALRIGK